MLQIPIVVHKEPEFDEQGGTVFDADGKQKFLCGFRIGGGIDQDPALSPQGYPDKVERTVQAAVDKLTAIRWDRDTARTKLSCHIKIFGKR